ESELFERALGGRRESWMSGSSVVGVSFLNSDVGEANSGRVNCVRRLLPVRFPLSAFQPRMFSGSSPLCSQTFRFRSLPPACVAPLSGCPACRAISSRRSLGVDGSFSDGG